LLKFLERREADGLKMSQRQTLWVILQRFSLSLEKPRNADDQHQSGKEKAFTSPESGASRVSAAGTNEKGTWREHMKCARMSKSR